MDVGIMTAKVRRDRLHHARRESRLLIRATCLTGRREELVEQVRALAKQGLRQIMLYPSLNRRYRVIEDFAEKVMTRL